MRGDRYDLPAPLIRLLSPLNINSLGVAKVFMLVEKAELADLLFFELRRSTQQKLTILLTCRFIFSTDYVKKIIYGTNPFLTLLMGITADYLYYIV